MPAAQANQATALVCVSTHWAYLKRWSKRDSRHPYRWVENYPLRYAIAPGGGCQTTRPRCCVEPGEVATYSGGVRVELAATSSAGITFWGSV